MPQIDPGLFQLFVLGLLVVGILVLGSTLLTMSRLKDVLRSRPQQPTPEPPTEDRKAQRDAITPKVRRVTREAERHAQQPRANRLVPAAAAEEEHWLLRGVTARRARNEGRKAKLMEMRAQRASMIAPQGAAKLVTARPTSTMRSPVRWPAGPSSCELPAVCFS